MISLKQERFAKQTIIRLQLQNVNCIDSDKKLLTKIIEYKV